MMSCARIVRISFVLPMLVLFPSVVGASPSATNPAAPLAGITVSFKVDSRVIDPTHGGAPWISPPTYSGAYAQDTVQARADGIDVAGRVSAISAKWIASDPSMVKVSPTQGSEVRIVVKHAGESRVKVVSGRVTQVLVVQARYQGKFIQVAITQLRNSKPPSPGLANKAPALENTGAEKEKDGLTSLRGGLRYRILKKTDGPTPTEDDVVECRYRLFAMNGQEVDGPHGDQRATFAVAESNLKEALRLMPVGSKWQILVPSRPAPSGNSPRGRRRAASTVRQSVPLVVEVELLAIKSAPGERGAAASEPAASPVGISL